MSDFLSRLVDRTLQRLPVLEPRRPSLFESLATRFNEPPIEQSLAEEGTGPNEVSRRSRNDRDEPNMQIPQVNVTPRTIVEHGPVKSEASKPLLVKGIDVERSRPSPQVDSPPQSVASKKAERADRSERVPPRKRSAITSETTSPRLIETIVERRHETFSSRRDNAQPDQLKPPKPQVAAPQPPPPTSPIVIKTVRAETVDQTQPPTRPRSPVFEPSPGRVVQPTSQRPIDVVAPTQRAAEFKRKLSASEGAQPATPTIQVTIGRVEVRATHPAATPPAPRSRTPRMSLDNYLRSRSGGTN